MMTGDGEADKIGELSMSLLHFKPKEEKTKLHPQEARPSQKSIPLCSGLLESLVPV